MSTAGLAFEEPYPVGPDCLPPTPRAIAWNRKARLLRAAMIAGLMLGPNGILLGGWMTGEDLRELEARGRSTTGQVTEATIRYHRRSQEYVIVYSYEVNGRSYRRTTTVSATEYATHARGKACEVTYLSDRPDVSYPGRPGPPLERHNELTVLAGRTGRGRPGDLAGVRRVLLAARTFTRPRGRAGHRPRDRAAASSVGSSRSSTTSTTSSCRRASKPSPPGTTFRNLYTSDCGPVSGSPILYDPANPKRNLPLYAFKYAYIRHDDYPADNTGADDAGETPS